jgi:RNA polymerase sigma factor (sigma-70 family)
MNDSEFAAVLERARQGDREAMARLVAEYEPEVRRVVRRRLGPALRAACESADLVQSVHRSLLRCLKANHFTFTGSRDLVALTVTMVRNKVAKVANRLRREQEILQLKAQLLSRARPDRAARAAEEIQGILESLKESDRRILALTLQGHNSIEAAHILGVNPDSLRVRKSRLFQKLRDRGVDLD